MSLANKRIREGDKVVILSGNDKGRTGVVLSRLGDRVRIQGINVRSKHVRRSEQNPKGQILKLEMPIQRSKVAICDKDNKPVKLRARLNAQGEKEYYFISNGQDVVHRLAHRQKK